MGIESIVGAVVSGLVSSLMKPEAPQAAKAPEVAAAPEKQADKTPEADVFRKKNAAAAGAEGPGSTLLAGSGGVSDSMLTLGKQNTLLGQ